MSMRLPDRRLRAQGPTVEVASACASAWWAALLWCTNGALDTPSWKVLRMTAGGESGVAVCMSGVLAAQVFGLLGFLPLRAHRAVLLAAAGWWIFVAVTLALAVPINTGTGMYAIIAGLNIAAYLQSRP